MVIKNETNHNDSINEHQKALSNIIITYTYLNNEISKVFKSHNITKQQFRTLKILYKNHPTAVSINLIKDKMMDKMSDVSRIVDRLRVKGLVKRRKSNTDRRAVEISITSEGIQLLKTIEPRVKNFPDLLKGLSAAEAANLNILLNKVRGK